MSDRVYSTDGEIFYEDFPDDELEIGDTYYEGVQVPIYVGDYLKPWVVQQLIELVEANIYDDIPEDIYQFDSIIVLEKDEMETLTKLIGDYLNIKVKLKHFKVKDVVSKIVEEGDI